jgi:hypothetical protein
MERLVSPQRHGVTEKYQDLLTIDFTARRSRNTNEIKAA